MSQTDNIPSWLNAQLFDEVLRQTVGDYQKVVKFKACNALGPGENYATIMLRVQMELQLPDNTLKTQSFMLKVAHDNKLYREQMSKFEMFQTEAGMYRDVVPEFENLYRDKGFEIRFGAKAYELPVAEEYVLVEDLAQRGFRNVKRQNCLDWDHTKCVLKKLAQWHAASAVRVAAKGPYAEQYLHGFITDAGRAMSQQMFENSLKYVLAATSMLPHHKEYYGKLETLFSQLTNVIFDQGKVDPNEFNVLNHGDFWCNNIMFQYDEEDKLQQTYFVDFQLPRYGSPAQDLWYFILSSTQLNFKIDRFDEMVSYYHDQLVVHLKMLDYTKPLPRLRDLHKKLLDMGSWAVMTVICIMAGVLCEPTEVANIDNFVDNSADADKFKQLLYFNERFISHLKVILPWLYYRGSFEC